MKGQRRAGELLQQAAVSQHLPEVSAAGLAMVLNVGCSQRENGVKRDGECDEWATGYQDNALPAPVRRHPLLFGGRR